MLKIEIESQVTEEISGISQKTKNEYRFFKQAAYLFRGDSKYPDRFELSHNDPKDALDVGFYRLSIDPSVVVDNNGNLKMDSRKFKFEKILPKSQGQA